jgi:hypothetical protein
LANDVIRELRNPAQVKQVLGRHVLGEQQNQPVGMYLYNKEETFYAQ